MQVECQPEAKGLAAICLYHTHCIAACVLGVLFSVRMVRVLPSVWTLPQNARSHHGLLRCACVRAYCGHAVQHTLIAVARVTHSPWLMMTISGWVYEFKSCSPSCQLQAALLQVGKLPSRTPANPKTLQNLRKGRCQPSPWRCWQVISSESSARSGVIAMVLRELCTCIHHSQSQMEANQHEPEAMHASSRPSKAKRTLHSHLY